MPKIGIVAMHKAVAFNEHQQDSGMKCVVSSSAAMFCPLQPAATCWQHLVVELQFEQT
jgi:hypothetical protein